MIVHNENQEFYENARWLYFILMICNKIKWFQTYPVITNLVLHVCVPHLFPWPIVKMFVLQKSFYFLIFHQWKAKLEVVDGFDKSLNLALVGFPNKL